MQRVWPIHGLFLAWLVFNVGCQPPPAPPIAAPAPASSTTDSPQSRSNLAAPSAKKLKEYWDAVFFEGTKVGYAHTVYESVDEGGRQLVKISAESALGV